MLFKSFDLTLGNDWTVACELSNEEDRFAASELTNDLARHGLALPVVSTAATRTNRWIVLANPVRDSSVQSLCSQRNLIPDPELGLEGYFLDMFEEDETIVICATNSAGIFYGVQTFKQLLKQTNESVYARAVSIHDWPDQRMRGMHFCGWSLNPADTDYFYRRVDDMARSKMNVAVIEHTYGMSDRASLREMFSYCRERHIEPIPELESGGVCAWMFQENPYTAEAVWIQDEHFRFNVGQDDAMPVNPAVLALPNMSFETDSNEDGVSDGWTFERNGRLDLTWCADKAHNGNWSVKIDIPGNDPVYSGELKSPLLQSRTSNWYVVNFWAQCNRNGGNRGEEIALHMLEYDSQTNHIRDQFGENSRLIDVTGDWKEYTMTFKTRPNTAKLRIFVNAWAGYGTVWIDDITLQDVNAALKNVVQTESTDITVMSLDRSRTYVKDVDYRVVVGDLPHWPFSFTGAATRIERFASGAIPADGDILVSYDTIPAGLSSAYWSHPCCMCMSEPHSYQIMHERMQSIIMDPGLAPKRFKLAHDEIGGINRDSRCLKRELSNAELLAENINKLYDDARSLKPDIQVMIWDDTLNGWHNGGGLNPNYPWGLNYQSQPPRWGKTGDTYLASTMISNGIVQCVWYYEPGGRYGVRDSMAQRDESVVRGAAVRGPLRYLLSDRVGTRWPSSGQRVYR